MTKEECIALLERYANHEGMGIPNLVGCTEAMKMAAELLKQPSTPEPELTEFEKRVKQLYDEGIVDGESGERITEDSLKESAAELLEIATKELVAKGEVITLGNLSPYARGFDDGKAEALKDLPRWKTIEEVTTKRTDENDCVTTETLLIKGWMNRDDYRIIEPNCMVNRKMLCIPVRDLEKLPKED